MTITINIKKFYLFCAGILVLAVGVGMGVFFSPAKADVTATVGYVDSQQALFSHPQYEDIKAQVQRVKEQKLNELSGYAQIDHLTDTQRQQLMDDLDRVQQEIDAEAQRLFEPIIQDVLDATVDVGEESGIEVIVDGDMVLFGGLNLTPLVISKLAGSQTE